METAVKSFILKIIAYRLPYAFKITYVIEIIILAFLIYELLNWIKNTRAWTLLKGIIVVAIFAAFAQIFQLTTITWILSKTSGVMVIAIVIIFQPELRRALDQLGQRNILFSLFSSKPGSEQGSEDSRSFEKINSEIVKAAFEMGKVKTGALIVIERDIRLVEAEKTGIMLDAQISSQLLINIFEHNTPLHDGAVIIRGGRIVAATCYLPLSDNTALSKDLGTRHRAGVGVSEDSDSLTIIVSEETGEVSIAEHGQLMRKVKPEYLKSRLAELNDSKQEDKLNKLRGMIRNDKKTDA